MLLQEILARFGYRLDSWHGFMSATAQHRLVDRARTTRDMIENQVGEANREAVTAVIWDPDDDDDGFLLLGGNRSLMLCEAISHLELLEQWQALHGRDAEAEAELAARLNGWLSGDAPGIIVRPVPGSPFAEIADTWQEAAARDRVNAEAVEPAP